LIKSSVCYPRPSEITNTDSPGRRYLLDVDAPLLLFLHGVLFFKPRSMARRRRYLFFFLCHLFSDLIYFSFSLCPVPPICCSRRTAITSPASPPLLPPHCSFVLPFHLCCFSFRRLSKPVLRCSPLHTRVSPCFPKRFFWTPP